MEFFLLKNLKNVLLSGVECLPIVEGGKGIGVSDWNTAGHFAKYGAVGTISGVNPSVISDNGDIKYLSVTAKNRVERHKQMLEHSVEAIVSQAKRANDVSGGKGRIHLNVLWEMGGTEYILENTLNKVQGLINGIVCGAGMPYKLNQICAKYKVFYYPIVSSMRAFRILWMRSYNKTKEWLGGVVYECPWRAGGHNGLTNAEDPFVPQNQYERVCELRKYMNEIGLQETPIIVAGGVWNIKEFESWLTDEKIGKVAFQFGTRPMLTQETPISDYWKNLLLNANKDDVKTNHFSPTGFWSSAMNTELLKRMFARLEREIKYSFEETKEFNTKIVCGISKTEYFIEKAQKDNVEKWTQEGYDEAVKTPDQTIVFISKEDVAEIKENMRDCYGCLSCCNFSTWSQFFPEQNYTCASIPDPRTFCIQKALQNAFKNIDNDKALFFAGSNAYRFKEDPMYANGYIPTTKELIAAIMEGN
ncbi:MAG: nitronate monooxygenase [Rickettsiales bacterium]|nr:MAG: nitronate monooxygenase [Rickettsiales bacterium]